MQAPRAFAVIVLLAVLAAPQARAEDPKPESKDSAASKDSGKDSDEFETSWFGVKAEIWYQPALSLHGQVGGLQGPAALVIPANTPFDAHDDLGVKTDTANPTYIGLDGCPLVLEAFVDTRWISLSAWWISPFEYKGSTVLTRNFDFAGVQFTASQPVETDLAQSIVGFDIDFNVINNRFVRLSPVVGVYALALDWGVKDPTPGSAVKASTEDINFPLTFGRFSVFPYPVVGGEVRAGYRDFVEVDAKLTGVYLNYIGVQAWTALFDVGVTGYLPFFNNVGMRVGYRYYYFQAKTDSSAEKNQFSVDMRLSGMTLALIGRF
jgi:hypothetical protein